MHRNHLQPFSVSSLQANICPPSINSMLSNKSMTTSKQHAPQNLFYLLWSMIIIIMETIILSRRNEDVKAYFESNNSSEHYFLSFLQVHPENDEIIINSNLNVIKSEIIDECII